MSCIDAAIIKALVEHIGMDPSDVPVGSPHECIKYTAGEGININGDNVISATDSCKCVKYTAGEGINITNNVISTVKNSTNLETYDDACVAQMNLKDTNDISVAITAPVDKPIRVGDVIRIKKTNGEVYSYYLVWIEKAYGKNTIFRGYDYSHEQSGIVTILSQNESTIQYELTDESLLYAWMDKNVGKENGTGVFRCNDTIANSIAALSYWVPLLCKLKGES